MNKTEFVQILAARLGVSQGDAARALDAVLDTIVEQAARGEKVSLTGFGAFERVYRSARVVRNPASGERKPAEETWVPRFRAGEAFRRRVAERR